MKSPNHFGWKWPLSPCTYILKFEDGSFYFGSTARPFRIRLGEHEKFWSTKFTPHIMCVGTQEYVELIEQRLIKKYAGHPKVRNKLHPGGGKQPHAKRVRRHGKTYPSIAAAARALDIRQSSVRDQIKCGTTEVLD